METLTQPGPREGDAQTDPGRMVKGSPNTQGVRKHFKQREEIISWRRVSKSLALQQDIKYSSLASA